MVQYFERQRFEYHPEAPADTTRAARPAGRRTGERAHHRRLRRGAVARRRRPPDRSTSPQTGHTLSGRFLTYWNRYGGLAIFGYPLSEEFQEVNGHDGKTYTVQYFERARFEYHPENAGSFYEVLLGFLGRWYSGKQ